MNTYVLALLVVFVAYANAKISCYQCISSVDEGCDSSETDALEKYKKVRKKILSWQKISFSHVKN